VTDAGEHVKFDGLYALKLIHGKG